MEAHGETRTIRRFGVALVALVIVAHIAAVFGDMSRPLHVDECEYLHTAWLMDQGLTIYRDFMQDHPPFLFQFMNLFNPRAPGDIYPLLDIQLWTEIGRVLAGLGGALALIAAAMSAFQAARSTLAALVALAYVLQDAEIWQRGLADLRLDPFALAMLWGGAVLVLTAFRREPSDRDAFLSGVGIALVTAAALFNPKWPIESIVVGVVHLMTLRRVRRWRPIALSLLPTGIVLVVAAALLLSVTTFAEYVYFTFGLKTAIKQNVMRAGLYGFATPRWWTVIGFGDVVVILAATALLFSAARSSRLRDTVDVPRLAVLVALCFASIAELPLYEPYTTMWKQYRISYVVAVGILYGVVLTVAWRALLPLIVRRSGPLSNGFPFGVAAVIAAAVAIAALSGAIAGKHADPNSWAARAVFQHKIRDGDRVWVGMRNHPVAAHNASYFYYGYWDVTAGAIPEAASGRPFLPRMNEKDLPPCRILAGVDRQTRFIEVGLWLAWYPQTSRCIAALLERRALSPTPHGGVFEVRRPDDGGPRYQPPRKAEMSLRWLENLARDAAAENRDVARRVLEAR